MLTFENCLFNVASSATMPEVIFNRNLTFNHNQGQFLMSKIYVKPVFQYGGCSSLSFSPLNKRGLFQSIQTCQSKEKLQFDGA